MVITSQTGFDNYFGMATTMTTKPTSVNFKTHNVIALIPNPATETCRVEFDTRGKLGTLTLTDALGRTVKSVELQGNGQHDFSVADMPSGVYYLRVNAEGKLLASGKLVVEK